MDEKSLTRLDLIPFLETLGNFCKSRVSGAAFKEILPLTDWEGIEKRRSLFYWMEGLLEKSPQCPSYFDFGDPKEEIKNLRREGYSPDSVLTLLALFRIISELDQILLKEKIPWFHPEMIPTLQRLRIPMEQTRRIFLDNGEIRDSASDNLGRIRKGISKMVDSLKRTAARLGRTLSQDGILQDEIQGERHGRVVLLLNRNFKGKVPGIVHGSSGSGLSLYFEPSELVELNNAKATLKEEEMEEIRRLLHSWLLILEEHQLDLNQAFKILLEIDQAYGLVAYRKEFNAHFPKHSQDKTLSLFQMRHPLLGEQVIPTDAFLSPEKPVLIISGPNSGGKTVFLKTLGLLSVLNQMGIPIPVEPGSSLPIFKNIYMELGDDQSIFTQLSRFSSHIGEVGRILKISDPDCLILFDELAGSTSPSEGDALACSISRALKERGIFSVITSHFDFIKSLGLEHEGFRNAAFQFNRGDLTPTFQIVYDVVGTSFALPIARRYGISPEILAVASEYLQGDREGLEKLSALFQKKLRQLRRKELKNHEEGQRLKEGLFKLEQERADFEARRQKGMDKILEKEFEEFFTLKKEVFRSLSEKKSFQTGESRELQEKVKKMEGDLFKKEAPKRLEEFPNHSCDPQIGDQVHLEGMGMKGVLLAIQGKKGRVEVEGRPLWVDLLSIKSTGFQAPKSVVSKGGGVHFAGSGTATLSLNVVGERLAEAKEKVTLFLDQSLMMGFMDILLIHGTGQGILKKGLRELLKEEFPGLTYREGKPEEGGAGVTVVSHQGLKN